MIIWQTSCGANEVTTGWYDQGIEGSIQVREIPTSNHNFLQNFGFWNPGYVGWADVSGVRWDPLVFCR